MARITATEAQRDFSDILDRVEDRGESFEIARGGKVVAKIEPASEVESKRLTLGELLKHLREEAPRLDPEDAIQFEKDLEDIRKSAGPAPYKWD